MIERNGWLNKDWDVAGEALNRLLGRVSADIAANSTIDDVLDAIVKNVDLNNYAEITAALTAIGNEAISKGSIGPYNTEKRNEYYQRLFKGNFENIKTFRDGGSKEIKLKDGTTIYQNFAASSPRNERGHYTVTKPDGSIEKYDDEGKFISSTTKQPYSLDKNMGVNLMGQPVDLNNFSQVSIALTLISMSTENSQNSAMSGMLTNSKIEASYKALFGENFESFTQSGDTREIKLKNGTTIYQNIDQNAPESEFGGFKVQKSDKTVEYYNQFGEPIQK